MSSLPAAVSRMVILRGVFIEGEQMAVGDACMVIVMIICNVHACFFMYHPRVYASFRCFMVIVMYYPWACPIFVWGRMAAGHTGRIRYMCRHHSRDSGSTSSKLMDFSKLSILCVPDSRDSEGCTSCLRLVNPAGVHPVGSWMGVRPLDSIHNILVSSFSQK